MSHIYLSVTTGPMFSGKSTAAKGQQQRLALADQPCLTIKHCSDDARLSDEDEATTKYTESGQVYRETPVSLHSGTSASYTAVSVARLHNVPEELLAAAQHVLLEEGQWFPNLVSTVLHWVRVLKLHVHVYCLDSDFRQIPFANVAQLMVFAHSVHHLHAVCMECGSDNASLSVKREGIVSGGEAIVPGGKGMYKAVCVACVPTTLFPRLSILGPCTCCVPMSAHTPSDSVPMLHVAAEGLHVMTMPQ